jgi:hypothetical protein
MIHRNAVCWCRREDYERVRRMMRDPHNFPASFDEWLDLAEQQFAQFAAQGFLIEKVILDPDHFAAFCAATKIEPDQQARMRYAVSMLDREEPGHG